MDARLSFTEADHLRDLLRQTMRERDEARAEVKRLHDLIHRGQCPCCVPRSKPWMTTSKPS